MSEIEEPSCWLGPFRPFLPCRLCLLFRTMNEKRTQEWTLATIRIIETHNGSNPSLPPMRTAPPPLPPHHWLTSPHEYGDQRSNRPNHIASSSLTMVMQCQLFLFFQSVGFRRLLGRRDQGEERTKIAGKKKNLPAAPGFGSFEFPLFYFDVAF